MRRSLRLLLLAPVAFTLGCGDKGTLPTTPPSPTEGSSRPRPGEDGKMPKGNGGAPKGAMKPVAD